MACENTDNAKIKDFDKHSIKEEPRESHPSEVLLDSWGARETQFGNSVDTFY